jgi:hypothetical protein
MRHSFALPILAFTVFCLGLHHNSLASPPLRKTDYSGDYAGDYAARPGYILVRRQPEIPRLEMLPVHNAARVDPIEEFDLVPGLELVKTKPGVAVEDALRVYQAAPVVLYSEPDYYYYTQTLPNDPGFAQQWGLHNVGQTGGTLDADINAPEAWGVTVGSKPYVLGIIDTGVDYRHPDLVNNLWRNTAEIPGNGIDDDSNGYIDDVFGINAITGTGDPTDDNQHGTHVAGIIGAQGNSGVGISGVMPRASMASCKFLGATGSGAASDAIACLRYFHELKTRRVNPIDIIATNNSWGGGPYSYALYDAIKQNRDDGILFMAAASNAAKNNDFAPTYPSSYDLTNIIAVAAFDHKNQMANFSNYGLYSVHVAAPGVNILSTVPGGRYASLSGTSMATPFVTGLAGLIKSDSPDLNWIQIKNLIIASGKPSAAAKETTISGRRIRAWDRNGEGALTCAEQKVVRRTLPKQNSVVVKLGGTLLLSILNINCEGNNTTSSVLVGHGPATLAPVSLNDRGINGDALARDGVFTGIFRAAVAGTYQLRFPGNDIVAVRVVN